MPRLTRREWLIRVVAIVIVASFLASVLLAVVTA